MGYRIKITYPDGRSHTKKQVYETKAGAERKARWYKAHLTPEVKVVKS